MATNNDTLQKMRHTAAHVLAAASAQLKPETRLGVGPAIDDGFYHDIEVDENWTEADLPKLQKKMEEIKNMALPITHRQMDKSEAKKLFAKDPYKIELIDEIPDETVGISDMGGGFFITLCKGGHVASTADIGEFRLTRLAGVYWQGDALKPQLQRIYGVLFPTKKELKEHLRLREEAVKRDHRRLGKELDLFTFSPLVGPGLPLFTPRGTIIRRELENFLQSLQEPRGYSQVTIPHIAKSELYKVSGHWDKFKENLFYVKGKTNDELVIKPMNCPHHTQIYAARPRSYRDLPLRLAETTMIYRDEKPGELLGLARVRSITQDDAHIFCTPDQLSEEISTIIDLVSEFYAAFNFKLEAHLSVRDLKSSKKYLGDDAIWEKAEAQLAESLTTRGMKYKRDEGEAAFYGPKIDFIAQDSLNRSWQLATIQLDFNMPVRFGLTYDSPDGSSQIPIMIHRAISGSIERFLAILLEHYAGALPLWLSPLQVMVVPISDEQHDYAQKLESALVAAKIRAQVDDRPQTMGKKIREAEVMKVPVIVIAGQKEVTAQTVSVRSRVLEVESITTIASLVQKISDVISQRG